MGLDKPSGQIEPPKSDIMKEREELRKLLESKPLTSHVLGSLDERRDDARYWENKVTETPETKNNIPLQERFLESHEGFVSDLNEIHYSLGRLAEVKEMLAAAKAVEWQTVNGQDTHKMFVEAATIVEKSETSLDSAKDATVRKLEGLMKMGYVHDKIHEGAEKENESLDKDRTPAG